MRAPNIELGDTLTITDRVRVFNALPWPKMKRTRQFRVTAVRDGASLTASRYMGRIERAWRVLNNLPWWLSHAL